MKPELVSQTLKDIKTETRRLNGLDKINEDPDRWELMRVDQRGNAKFTETGNTLNERHIKSPYGGAGDIIWVRETFLTYQTVDHIRRLNGAAFSEISDGNYAYVADGFDTVQEFKDHTRLMIGSENEAVLVKDNKWTPNIHMPLAASRLFLEITEINYERLGDITEESAFAEGIDPECDDFSKAEHFKAGGSAIEGGSPSVFAFIGLWDSINWKTFPWSSNPWVRVVKYKRVEVDKNQIKI